MSTYLKMLIEELAETSLQEVLGKFDLNYFKKLSANSARPSNKAAEEDFAWRQNADPSVQHPEIAYAKSMLPMLGEGSSRITFALSGSKVLKISMNQRGFQQNQAEVETYQRESDSQLITKIFDFDPQYKWVIAEIVKEIDPSQFEQYTGISPQDMHFFAQLKSLQGAQQRARALEAAKSDPKMSPRFHTQFQWKLDALYGLFKNPRGIQFMEGVWALIEAHDLHWGDIVPEHFGRTVDGQVRLFDYGLTEKMYQGWG